MGFLFCFVLGFFGGGGRGVGQHDCVAPEKSFKTSVSRSTCLKEKHDSRLVWVSIFRLCSHRRCHLASIFVACIRRTPMIIMQITIKKIFKRERERERQGEMRSGVGWGVGVVTER